jgi:hypothetical protein
MDVNVGLVEAIKMIEERIPGGRYITTTAMLLGAISVIIVSLRYIISSIFTIPIQLPPGMITSPILLKMLTTAFWAMVGLTLSLISIWSNRLFSVSYEQMRDALRELQSKVEHFEQTINDTHRK